ncbi:MAG: hypothetical protein CMQ05_11300 [Gammaproteobacteria bacterium]|uniref:Fatty acid hydroxylase domain-containing protein n=1 Tax=OM182 bacterium MED-G24 TaxID=1986255 RepID=A0A2A5WPD9_9GAMM|nr:hypothetical protein [Gammaproteobacteria bacterium]PDH38128.1 MAG: hypothetical protein CNE99_07340 [OM182 bacterium MED-G24]RPG24614.1 MAG: hypothetical protein CBC10_010805 [Gammaproteobacteria bacterium TMED50]|tara:strand:- start:12819 stop:13103 length:285 start_codon:yes stop_codon:yes gene_type:complete
MLIGDFFAFLSHVVRHKWQTAWWFHSVHHSQRELTYFSEYRSHPGDILVIAMVTAWPMFSFEQAAVPLAIVTWVRHFHTRFYQSNIKTNLVFLR